ncbi:hypothetical protein Ciccas_011497, partial [Cichlidogyrus casuarinus]
ETYYLTVAARDQGQPFRSNHTELVIRVDDSEPLNTSLNDRPSNDGVALSFGPESSTSWDINQIIMIGIVSVSSVVCVILFAGIFFFAKRIRGWTQTRRRDGKQPKNLTPKSPYFSPQVQPSSYQIFP